MQQKIMIDYRTAQIFEAHNFLRFSRTSKIKLREILEYRIDGNVYYITQNPWSAKIVPAKFLKTAIRENCAPRKFGAVRCYNNIIKLINTNNIYFEIFKF